MKDDQLIAHLEQYDIQFVLFTSGRLFFRGSRNALIYPISKPKKCNYPISTKTVANSDGIPPPQNPLLLHHNGNRILRRNKTNVRKPPHNLVPQQLLHRARLFLLQFPEKNARTHVPGVIARITCLKQHALMVLAAEDGLAIGA